MHTLKLYFFPGTCARVSLIALEELNLTFETQLIVLPRGEHKSPDYLKLNPKGKVPTLLIDGQPLTENLAIISYLQRTYPQARLLPPPSDDALADAQVLADLSWFISTIHPLLTGIAVPQVYCATPEGAAQTKAQMSQLMNIHMNLIDQRLSQQPWMLGAEWSIIDAYAFWAWDEITRCGYDGSIFLNIEAHAQRSKQRPSVQRALKHEGEAFAWMARQGILPPPPTS